MYVAFSLCMIDELSKSTRSCVLRLLHQSPSPQLFTNAVTCHCSSAMMMVVNIAIHMAHIKQYIIYTGVYGTIRLDLCSSQGEMETSLWGASNGGGERGGWREKVRWMVIEWKRKKERKKGEGYLTDGERKKEREAETDRQTVAGLAWWLERPSCNRKVTVSITTCVQQLYLLQAGCKWPETSGEMPPCMCVFQRNMKTQTPIYVVCNMTKGVLYIHNSDRKESSWGDGPQRKNILLPKIKRLGLNKSQ